MFVSHLLVLQFDSHHTEAIVDSVVVDVDAAEALLARFDWHPFFAGVIIDHHRGSGLTYTLFTEEKTGTVVKDSLCSTTKTTMIN